MARKADEERFVPHSPYDVHRAAWETLMQMCSGTVSQNGWLLHGTIGMDMMSWGGSLRVEIVPAQGGCVVRAHSENSLPTQLVDYGRNKDNVKAVFFGIFQRLGPGPADRAPGPQGHGAMHAPGQGPMPGPGQGTTRGPGQGWGPQQGQGGGGQGPGQGQGWGRR